MTFEQMNDEELSRARESAGFLLSPDMRSYLPTSLSAPLSEFAADLCREERARQDHDTVDFPVPDYDALGFNPGGTQMSG